jgi:DNA-binding response OmpR family regulator
MVQFEPIRLLYVEDDPGLARLVQKRLQRAGYVVNIASDVKEGIAKYTEKFTLLIRRQSNRSGQW